MSKTFYRLLFVCVLGLNISHIRASETTSRYLGESSCSSSGCHGGAGEWKDQCLVWSVKDFHSHRPPATLSTARSRQIAEAAGISKPMEDPRCVVCHAPLKLVPASRRGPDFNELAGVSCESCHSPAESWVRAHTRTDWTRADRTAAGMRDLQNIYVRANNCVACHQVVDQELLHAGHPELIFELDGQSVTEPKHWRPAKNGPGGQVWFVGQAIALREMSWQLSQEANPDSRLEVRWSALVWLMSKVNGIGNDFPALPSMGDHPEKEQFDAMVKASDALAKMAASATWTDEMTSKALTILAGSQSDFTQDSGDVAARRAERLVLALDRLTAKPDAKSEAGKKLGKLFDLSQSVADFSSKQFADALGDFRSSL